MFRFIILCLGTLVRLLQLRRSLLLENLALRQQLAVLKRRHPKPRIGVLDKLFWVALRRFWSGRKQSLIVVTPRDCSPVAPGRFPLILAADLQGQGARGKKTDVEGSSGIDLQAGCGESDMGSAPDTRGTPHARFCSFREDDFTVDETSSERSRTGTTLALLSAQSPGSPCGDGFLRGPDDYLRCTLWVFRDQP
jgi:hypothetical protein